MKKKSTFIQLYFSIGGYASERREIELTKNTLRYKKIGCFLYDAPYCIQEFTPESLLEFIHNLREIDFLSWKNDYSNL
jgi:hypothetical protein